MEPVPETERMEEFKTSSVPTLRLQEPATIYEGCTDRNTTVTKPPCTRRSTDPILHSPRYSSAPSPSIPYRPRNTSPLARGSHTHIRSKSTASALAPTMSRAQSMPGTSSTGHLFINTQHSRPASPIGSPIRVRTSRKPADEVFPGFAAHRSLNDRSLSGISETETIIPLNEPKVLAEPSSSPALGVQQSALLPRTRRPSSPLRFVSQQTAAGSLSSPSTPSSTASLSYPSSRFELLSTSSCVGTFSYPGLYASSSVPSTPTSARSRSPSISSLETIPDAPGAEEAALEAEKIAQLKAAADAEDGGVDESKKTGSEVISGRGRTLGVVFGARDKRKRWSVCGAERRGDLNLDTIWED
ncbi:hypothetical protein BJ878DRAFT_267607 [Calycina marina]|uniref:Basic proline-rich protein n=1 Tax=Calycina marina TaxID=1763456 RepID=A0A9P7Z7B0_9HELO|nr:hypothetical protein BJ878DRAFT_267607 [Calycina marina]